MTRSFRTFCAVTAAAAALASTGQARGDLLVTDRFGGRVVRIDPTGAVETFSPPSGGTNYLVGPAGIVVAPDGDAYVVDNETGLLVRIDGLTGVQSIVRGPDLGPFDDPEATNVGDNPWGIDVAEDVLGIQRFYVSAADGIHVATQQWPLSPYAYVGSLLDATLPAHHYGVAVRSDGAVLDSVWVAAGVSGLWTRVASSGTASEVLPAVNGEQYLDVEFEPGVPTTARFTRVEVAGFGFCSAGGVFAMVLGYQPLSQGGLLRCPFALASSPGRDEIYVADMASSIAGGEGRIVKLTRNGSVWEQSLFVDDATLGVSAPAGIAYVPEPGAGVMGVAAAAALAAAERRRTTAQRGFPSADRPASPTRPLGADSAQIARADDGTGAGLAAG